MTSVNIVLISPRNYVHSLALANIGRLLQYSFESLQVPCRFRVNTFDTSAVNVVLGYHLVQDPRSLAPHRPVIYQLEQLSDREGWFDSTRLEVLRTASEVWDYSPENVEFLNGKGIEHVKLLPIGFHERLRTIPDRMGSDVQNSILPGADITAWLNGPTAKMNSVRLSPPIDVLFYGSMNERRKAVLQDLARDLTVKALFGVYGPERDAWIARSKIVLNIHYYERQILEQVRISYLLNNRRFVLSEQSAHNPYGAALATAPYSELAAQCRFYLDRADERERLADAGLRWLQERPMTENLRHICSDESADDVMARCA